ncbi:hypothetical protein GGR50DRAFT_668951 [Xylaria sp. CBS 124048]|nr:hypothetical protein GGR50DRAFT_668951 [Xylaria sp. CBS 124048]
MLVRLPIYVIYGRFTTSICLHLLPSCGDSGGSLLGFPESFFFSSFFFCLVGFSSVSRT